MEVEFGVLVFMEGGTGEHGEPGEKTSEQGENQRQTQLTYGTGPESTRGHIGGRQTISPLRHPWLLPVLNVRI